MADLPSVHRHHTAPVMPMTRVMPVTRHPASKGLGFVRGRGWCRREEGDVTGSAGGNTSGEARAAVSGTEGSAEVRRPENRAVIGAACLALGGEGSVTVSEMVVSL